MIADIASIELESVAIVDTIRVAARKDAHSISFLFITGLSRSTTPEQNVHSGLKGALLRDSTKLIVTARK